MKKRDRFKDDFLLGHSQKQICTLSLYLRTSVTRCWSYKEAQMLQKFAQNGATAVLHKLICDKTAPKVTILFGLLL